MDNYTEYDYERTENQFKEHKDYEKMKIIKKQIIDYFTNVKNEYVNEKSIMENIMNIFDTAGKGHINKCIECGIDMGECNPRQYCGKLYCINN